MREKAAFVFWTSLILYCLTLATVTYVGVYLTYIAIPLIVMSGLVMKLSKPSEDAAESVGSTKSTLKGAVNVTDRALEGTAKALDGFNKKLNDFNSIMDLKLERTKELKSEILEIKNGKIEPNINFKYAKTPDERDKYNKIIKAFDEKIESIESKIRDIEKQCEIEVSTRRIEGQKKNI